MTERMLLDAEMSCMVQYEISYSDDIRLNCTQFQLWSLSTVLQRVTPICLEAHRSIKVCLSSRQLSSANRNRAGYSFCLELQFSPGTYTLVGVFVCVRMCVHECACVYAHVCVGVCMHTYLCVSVCVLVKVNTCTLCMFLRVLFN